MDFPQKIEAALATLNTARADGDTDAIERAESGVVFALASLDFDDFDHDDDARHVLNDEAHIGWGDDDASLIITVDHEDWSTISRDDPNSWRYNKPSNALFEAYLVATKIMHMMTEDLGTPKNAWIIALPVKMLEGDDSE